MATTKQPAARTTRRPGATVTESLTARSTAVKAKQDATRKAEGPAKATARAAPDAPDTRIATLLAWRSTATARSPRPTTTS